MSLKKQNKSQGWWCVKKTDKQTKTVDNNTNKQLKNNNKKQVLSTQCNYYMKYYIKKLYEILDDNPKS